MTVVLKARPASINIEKADFIKGVNADARKSAYWSIAPNAHAEGVSRATGLTNFRAALGTMPKGYDIAKPLTTPAHTAFTVTLNASKVEWLAGRACSRMPAGEFPKDCEETIARIDHVRALILNYASPEAKSIKGKAGKRSVIQHKVIRAAEQALSVFLAELNLSTAAKQSETDKKKRSTRKSAARGNPPSHSALVAADKPLTADDAHAFLDRQALMLADYCAKNAAKISTDYGSAFKRLVTDLAAAGKARDARKAAKEAGAHNG